MRSLDSHISVIVNKTNRSIQLFAILAYRVAWILLTIGQIPSCIIQYPRYSNMVLAKKDFFLLILSPVFCKFLKISFNFSRWSSRLPLVVYSKSSIYIQTGFKPRNGQLLIQQVIIIDSLLLKGGFIGYTETLFRQYIQFSEA